MTALTPCKLTYRLMSSRLIKMHQLCRVKDISINVPPLGFKSFDVHQYTNQPNA